MAKEAEKKKTASSSSPKAAAKKVAAPVKKTGSKPKATGKKTVKKATKKTTKKATKKAAPKAALKASAKTTKKSAAKKKSAPKSTVKVKASAKPGGAAKVKTSAQQQSGGVSTSQSASVKTPTINNYLKQMESYMPQTNFKLDQYAQEAANTSRESVEAFIKSGTIFAKGMESMMKTAASITQSAAEKQAQYAKELMSSKTLNEAAEKQNKIAQANFEEFMGNVTKLSEMSVKLMNDSVEPLNTQMTKTMNKAKKAA